MLRKLKKNYHLEKATISDDVEAWHDDFMTTLNSGNNLGDMYECMIDTRLYDKHIVEYFYIKFDENNDMIFEF